MNSMFRPPSDRAGVGGLGTALAVAVTMGARCRVLLVDDETDNQRLITHLLCAEGIEVTVADDGWKGFEEALSAFREGWSFDVILMDLQLPELDGCATTALLRATGYSGSIVALSATDEASAREGCLAAGCDAFASKPITRSDLLSLVGKYTAATRSNAA